MGSRDFNNSIYGFFSCGAYRVNTIIKPFKCSYSKRAYSESEKLKIINYINTGGNLLITTEPSNYNYLSPILDSLGLAINKGVLLQESENHQLDLVQAKFTPEAKKFGFSFYENAIIATPTASGISIKDSSKFKVNTILVSNKDVLFHTTSLLDTKMVFTLNLELS